MPLATFRVSQKVTLDATGSGTATVSPPVSWDVQLVSVLVTTSASDPTFALYVDSATPAGFVAGTHDGAQDAIHASLSVQPGQQLIGTWTSGDPGATATMTVRGVRGAGA